MAYQHITDSTLPLKCGAVQILEYKLWVWEHSIMYVKHSVSLLTRICNTMKNDATTKTHYSSLEK
jgi:hypothetical protein